MKTILAALNAKYIHSSLAIRYLKAYSQDDTVEIFDTTINDNPLDIAINIGRKKPSMVGFSCYIWNMENTLKVCSALKEINKDIIILLGGPEVTYDSRKVMGDNDYIDFIIQGEGEVPFKILLEELKREEPNLKGIEGLVYRNQGKVIENPPQGLINNLDEIPFPYMDGVPEKIIYYEATRGCPFNCKYCLSSTIKGLRYFTINRVKRDLTVFIEQGVNIVKFVDRTFNANKKFAMEIWKFLIENGGNTTFHFEIAADLLDDDELEVLKEAPKGLFQFEVGVQTTNPQILRNINRVMDFDVVKENILRIKSFQNIHCHLDLIAGLPGENLDSFKKSFDMCMSINPDVLQLGFLKILKGSPMYYESEKYDMHYIKYPPYQVLSTRNISFEEISGLMNMEEVFETYYNSQIFKLSMVYILSKIESKFEFFVEFTNFLKKREFFDRKMDLKNKFILLYEFSLNYCESYIISDVLLHDFIINTRKNVLPEFLKKNIGADLKDIVYQNRVKIQEVLGKADFKRIFYIPVNVKIFSNPGGCEVIREVGIAVFNLNEGKYFYL